MGRRAREREYRATIRLDLLSCVVQPRNDTVVALLLEFIDHT